MMSNNINHAVSFNDLPLETKIKIVIERGAENWQGPGTWERYKLNCLRSWCNTVSVNKQSSSDDLSEIGVSWSKTSECDRDKKNNEENNDCEEDPKVHDEKEHDSEANGVFEYDSELNANDDYDSEVNAIFENDSSTLESDVEHDSEMSGVFEHDSEWYYFELHDYDSELIAFFGNDSKLSGDSDYDPEVSYDSVDDSETLDASEDDCIVNDSSDYDSEVSCEYGNAEDRFNANRYSFSIKAPPASALPRPKWVDQPNKKDDVQSGCDDLSRIRYIWNNTSKSDEYEKEVKRTWYGIFSDFSIWEPISASFSKASTN